MTAPELRPDVASDTALRALVTARLQVLHGNLSDAERSAIVDEIIDFHGAAVAAVVDAACERELAE